MNRVIIFAHYDAKNLIQDYVVNYLTALKQMADKVVFVSDSDIEKNELNKIEKIVDFSLAQKHFEYDFGSYKRGYEYIKAQNWLKDCDELIFTNDSCYAPLFPLDDMLLKMEDKELDFWGATLNSTGIKKENGKYVNYPRPHVQSYFVAFKPSVFNSKIFDDFIKSVKKEETKEDVIINYEIGLTKLLEENGFKYDVYCSLSKQLSGSELKAYRMLVLSDKSPFLKRSIALYKIKKMCYPILLKNLIKKTDYDYNLILKDVKENAQKLTKFEHTRYFIKSFKKYVISRDKKQKLVQFFGKWYDYNNGFKKLYR